ncbi:hypothetical protein [Aquipuribacter nitratireducens]|uniref:Uncharacterized protein n=1 Tax=Aquipuribacter nitratireducens TaxID=650104 RepID=A0ABW0GP48_9MICO
MTRSAATPLDDTDRRHVRLAVWLMLAAAVVALLGIFGFGGLTGAGDYFDEDPAVSEAAVRDHYWQIWGILLPIGAAVLASGAGLFLLAGVLARIGSGWPAGVARVVRWLVLPLCVLAAVPYLLGPGTTAPGWLGPLTAISGMASYAATATLGVAVLRLPLPSWTGVALIVGVVLAAVSFLPLFVFVGTLVGGLGLLRWHARNAALPSMPRAGA